jgi:hypothetical protein
MKDNTIEPLNGQPKENEEKIEFEIRNYKIEIIKGANTIIFNATEIGDIKGSLFKNEIELNKFEQMDKYFRQFDNIDELYLDISKIKRNELEVEKIENNIKLILIYTIRGEQKEFPFILKREKINIENVVTNLCEKSKEIDTLKRENEELREKIAELQFMVSCIYHEKCKSMPSFDISAWMNDSKYKDWKDLNVYSERYHNIKCIIF